MPPRRQVLSEADRFLSWLLREGGHELRLARHNGGLTMAQVAIPLGWSKSKVSRIERGLSRNVSIADITRLSAVVGLRPSVKWFPAGRALRDVGQVELLAALNQRMHRSWHSTHEVPMPTHGDLRAADQISVIPGCRVMIEAYRRFTDYQAQTRSARAKQSELGADRLVLLLEETLTNRRALTAAGLEPRRSFPVSQRAALSALGSARDPGGDTIILLRRLRGAGRPYSRRVASDATKVVGTGPQAVPVARIATESA